MISLLFFLQFVFAEPAHKVEMVKGNVFQGTKKLAKGSLVPVGTKIEAKQGGILFLRLANSHMLMRFSGPGSFQITDEKKSDILELFEGIARVKSKDAEGRENFKIKTNTAVVGVRGTDFFFNMQPFLSEAEVVVFAGEIEFTNAKDPSDTKTIPAGHWGGVGGRYGQKIGELIKLPAHVLRHFDKNLSWL